MENLLFLCTGNYYRSCFAEILFNHLSTERAGDWRAISRGLRLNPANEGAISSYALAGLAERGIARLIDEQRCPMPVTRLVERSVQQNKSWVR